MSATIVTPELQLQPSLEGLWHLLTLLQQPALQTGIPDHAPNKYHDRHQHQQIKK
jgi:hypothetical protein